MLKIWFLFVLFSSFSFFLSDDNVEKFHSCLYLFQFFLVFLNDEIVENLVFE